MPREIETYKTVVISNHMVHNKNDSTLSFPNSVDNSNAEIYKALTAMHENLSTALNQLFGYLNILYDLNLSSSSFTYTQDFNTNPAASADVLVKINELFDNFNTDFNNSLATVSSLTEINFGVTAAVDSGDPDMTDGVGGTDVIAANFNAQLDGWKNSFLDLINNAAFNNLGLAKPQFKTLINIEFIPDEIVLKHISVNNQDGANSAKISLISSNLVEGDIILTVPGSSDGVSNVFLCESVDIPFRNQNRPVNGHYNFSILNHSGKFHTNTYTFNYWVSLTFLFIKFKSQ